MLPERLDQRLNDQLNHEFEASQAYIAMGAYFSIRGFYGFADFYLVQAEKKRSRAMKFYHYLVSADGNLLISKIDEPYCDFQSSLEVIQYSLEHEKVITDNIYSLILLAVELKAYPTLSFLQCFVDEQLEQEEYLRQIITELKGVPLGSKLFLSIDSKLSKKLQI
ncbi:ferritin [Priestia megaterium]